MAARKPAAARSRKDPTAVSRTDHITMPVGNISRTLGGALVQGRISHAYLFVMVSSDLARSGGGPIAGTSGAMAFASRLNCRNPVGDAACGKCLSCKLILDGNHPDVRVVFPDGLSIKIGQIREIKRDMSFRPRLDGGFRVIVIDSAERMTQEAQNSFLKLLEDPPGNVVFILIAANPSELLPTVRSRCQLVRVRGQERLNRDRFQGAVEEIRKAHSYSAFQVLEVAESIERGLQAGGGTEQPRRELEGMLVAAAAWFRDVLVLKETGDAGLAYAAEGPAAGERAAELARDGELLDARSLIYVIGRIEEARQQARKNANIRLVLESLLFDVRRAGCR